MDTLPPTLAKEVKELDFAYHRTCLSVCLGNGVSRDGAPSNGELNSRKAGKGWKQVPFRAKGLTLGWKHPREQ
jgi:hypothetical protein